MRVQANGKMRRSRAEWREIFGRFETSDLSEAAFCRREGIAKGSFSRWKRCFGAPEGEKSAFVEFSPPVRPSSASLEAGEMELVLPGGVRLRWKPQRVWGGEAPRRIFAYTQATDMRKSFQGLLALVQRVFTEDPYSGSLFVFVNRRGNYVKILAWDRTGFALYAKRLERGRFRFPNSSDHQELSEQALRFLLDGIPLGIKRRRV